jgi:hypothetical protein
MAGSPSWDQQSLASTFSTMTLNQPQGNDWYFNSGATSHMTPHAATPSHTFSPRYPVPSSIVVGNGSLLPVTSTSPAHLPGYLRLNNVLVPPSLIKNLISERQFISDNNCSVEFDPVGYSVKDLRTQNVLVMCNSSGPLYPLRFPAATALTAASTSSLWHRRLGHPGHEALSKLASVIPPCNKEASSICHVCQLGCHVRLPFHASSSRATSMFDLIHCDLWTSSIPSVSGYKYYLVFLDDFLHYLWKFPLQLKSDAFTTIAHFFSHVATQFGTSIKAVQCNNGREFDNSTSRTFFLTRSAHLRMSCPYTSPQNGKAKRIIRSTNNIIRSLLFLAAIPSTYWVEALYTATYPLNILPTKTLQFSTPDLALFGTQPTYEHLRVFECKCYPDLSATAAHKLAPRSSLCVFLGYSAHHKGYRCLDLSSNRIIISRHSVFDETSFPFAEHHPSPSPADFDFLDDISNPMPAPIGPSQLPSPAGSHGDLPRAPALPRAPPLSAQPRAAPDDVACTLAPVPGTTSRLPRAAGLLPGGPRLL